MEDFLRLDVQLSDEERLVRRSVQRLVVDQVLPVIGQAFEQAQFPDVFISATADAGLLGMTLPLEYGGASASAVSYGLACQELEYGDSGLRSFVSVQSSLCMYPIYAFGDKTQKTHYLPRMAAGQCIGCFGLTEPDAGSNPAEMRTRAEKIDGGWLLNGSKIWITNASIADVAIVWAKTSQGIRGFIVDKETPGFTQRPIHHKLSLRASVTGELIFEDCLVPEGAYLAGSECGLSAPLKCLTQARFGIAWGAIGAAMACYDAVCDYVLSRRQFGKPIGAFQLVQQDLADMLTEIVKAQTLNLQIGRLKDSEQCTPVMVSLAKRNACRSALHIARQARNLLGANGISLEYPIIRHMANLESVFTYEGTDNVHTLVLGKHITGINAFE